MSSMPSFLVLPYTKYAFKRCNAWWWWKCVYSFVHIETTLIGDKHIFSLFFSPCWCTASSIDYNNVCLHRYSPKNSHSCDVKPGKTAQSRCVYRGGLQQCTSPGSHKHMDSSSVFSVNTSHNTSNSGASQQQFVGEKHKVCALIAGHKFAGGKLISVAWKVSLTFRKLNFRTHTYTRIHIHRHYTKVC